MSSVGFPEKCPKCGYNEAYCEQHSSGHSFIFCDRCGYSNSNWPDDKGEVEPAKGGYGSFKIGNKPSYTLGSFENKKSIKNFIYDFNKNGGHLLSDGTFAEVVIITFKKKGKWYVKDLVNNTETEWEFNKLIEAL